MTKIQSIIYEINQLTQEERAEIMKELRRKESEERQLQAILDEFIGAGEGVWLKDSQDYISTMRKEDRF